MRMTSNMSAPTISQDNKNGHVWKHVCMHETKCFFFFSELRTELSPVTCKQPRTLFCYEFYCLTEWVDGAVDADPVFTPQGWASTLRRAAHRAFPTPCVNGLHSFPRHRIVCPYRYDADETFPLKLAFGRKSERIPKRTLMLWSHPAGQNKVCGGHCPEPMPVQ